jgi:hypothetical protein
MLSRIRIDSAFAEALAFDLLRICFELKDDAQLAAVSTKQLSWIRVRTAAKWPDRYSDEGVSVTCGKDSHCLKGIVCTSRPADIGEAAQPRPADIRRQL